MIRLLFTFLILPVSLPGLTFQWEKLPDWAENVMHATGLEQAPAYADLWRLLDVTRFSPAKAGRYEVQRRIVQYVVNHEGGGLASIFIIDGDEEGTKIKRLKGWHLKANGKLDKLNKNNALTIGNSRSEMVNTSIQTLAQFQKVGAGSVIVFESTEIHDAFFPVTMVSVINPFPTKRRVIEIVPGGGESGNTPEIVPQGFEDWGLNFSKTHNSLVIKDLPGFENERFEPAFPDPYPRVHVGLWTSGEDRLRLASWDNLAKWYHDLFEKNYGGSGPTNPLENASLNSLRQLASFFDEKITYRQRYLSHARGWVPASGADVTRRAYGDCKDMISCLAYQSEKKGLHVYPVLASISDGFRVSPDDTPHPFFNHLIGAVYLGDSLGLPAEIDIDGKYYVLIDPTSKYTPLGMLPAHYKDFQVMVCTATGARWVTIPDTALEPTASTVKLSGLVDENFTLNGTLQVEERGDAYFLRTTNNSGNPVSLEAAFRYVFDIPGTVSLKQVANSLDEDQRLQLIYQVTWPSFFQRDAGSLRLNPSIVGRSKTALTRRDKTRQNPIAFRRRPETTWVLELQSKVPLRPGSQKFEWKDAFQRISWSATSGTKLVISFTESRDAIYFPKEKIADGAAYWAEYRKQYNGFWLQGTLFDPE